MPTNRGIWLILAAVVLVLIGLYVRPTANRTPEAPPAAPTPPVATGAQPPAANGGGAGSAQTGEQKSASAPAAQAPVQPAPKEAAPEPAPQPAATPSSKTAEQETSPAPAATPATGAPASEKEGAPAPASGPPAQTVEKETPPPSAPSPQTAPAAAAGEKEPAGADKNAETHANDKASAELAALRPGFVAKDLVAALNDSEVSFDSDSAEVPASLTDFLHKAAEDLKQLPKGHVVEIAGYTDNTGDQALNVALSERRAEAVRQMLIKFGADPETLIAKGYGSADPIASNDTAEGRRRNRRIEYRIIKTP